MCYVITNTTDCVNVLKSLRDKRGRLSINRQQYFIIVSLLNSFFFHIFEKILTTF